MKLTADQKEKIISAIEEEATLLAGARAAGVEVWDIKEEMKRSAIFRKRVKEAREEGKLNLADRAIANINKYASGQVLKTDRNVLTANIALANAYEPGFKGTSKVEGKIEHDVRVITAVPRPNYDEPKITIEDKEKLKQLNEGKPIMAKDRIKTVEEAIEGEVIEHTS